MALSLLQIVDNPRQDVPLISVLRSPVYGFHGGPAGGAALRAQPDGDFYAAVVQAAGGGGRGVTAPLSWPSWRSCASAPGTGPATSCSGRSTTAPTCWACSAPWTRGRSGRATCWPCMPAGRAVRGRRAPGLCSGFLACTWTRLRDNGDKLAAAASRPGRGAACASCPSTSSKGLEFPVVLLCRTDPAAQPGRHPAARPVPPACWGWAPRGLDRERMVEYPTLARQGGGPAAGAGDDGGGAAAALRGHDPGQGEADPLHAPCTAGCGRRWRSWRRTCQFPAAPMALWSASRAWASWVLLHGPHPAGGGAALRSMAGLPEADRRGDLGPAWDIRWVDGGGIWPSLRSGGSRFADLPGESGTEAGGDLTERADLALPATPGPCRDPLQAHRHPAQGAGAGPGGRRRRQSSRLGEPSSAPQRQLATLRRPRFVPRRSAASPRPSGAPPCTWPCSIIHLDSGTRPERAAGGAGPPGGRGLTSPPSRGRRWTRASCPALLPVARWAGS